MSAAGNCSYGSTLSPPRLKQMRDALINHQASCHTSENDHLWQHHLPHIKRQLTEVRGRSKGSGLGEGADGGSESHLPGIF